MPTKVIMPQMGESVAEGTVTRWIKKVGDRVERDEPLFEISTDKVDAEIPSPVSGVLSKILVKENETVVVNTVVAEIDGETGVEAMASPAAKQIEASRVEKPRETARAMPAAPAPPPAPSVEPGRRTRSSPLVRKMARQHGIDLRQIQGTGAEGRISKKDILRYLARQEASRAVTPPPTPHTDLPVPPVGQTPIVFTGPTEVVPMTPIRKQTAEHMLASRRTSAHVTSVFEVEMTRVVETREKFGAEFERRNLLKLTYTPFIVRATVEALKEFRLLNASVEDTNIVYKRDINIGVAVALETGLIVPVIKQADKKNFLEIARAVQDLAERARSKHLSVEEVHGGTFTITNPGVFGSLLGTPIIHQPQVAILGVGAIEKRPVVRNDAIAIRPMVYLSLSFDHRLVDGAVADQFMSRLKHSLENWEEPLL